MFPEAKQLELLRTDEIKISPLEIKYLEANTPRLRDMLGNADALARICWGEKSFDFVIECKSRSTPKLVQDAIAAAKRYANPPDTYPLIMVPYLSSRLIETLKTAGVSGIDACGNGIIIVPEELLVINRGQPNKYPDSAPLKNVYRGDASMAARVFLRIQNFSKVNDVRDQIRDYRGNLALSTVSKALKQLEDDLLIAREKGSIRLLQQQELLSKLVENYRPPRPSRPPCTFKSSVPLDELRRNLVQSADSYARMRIAATGAGSVEQYATMAREPALSLYCTDMHGLVAGLPLVSKPGRFTDVELIETQDQLAYFDTVEVGGFPWASPLQTYLELMAGDNRDKETAKQVQGCIADLNNKYTWVNKRNDGRSS